MSKVKYTKLKELCSVNQGLQIPISKRFTKNGKDRFFYITIQFLKNSHSNKFYIENPPKSSICNTDDILIVRTGSTGKVVTGVNGSFHNNFFKINYDKEKIDGRYLYHCLNTKEKQKEMVTRAGITTIPDLNHFMFLDMKIPLVKDIKKQREISNILDSIDSKIKLNNRINTELEKMAKTLYDYWFVQFDFPDENGKPYKSSGGKMVFDEKLKREIPEGWKVKNLKNNFLTKLIKPKIDKFNGEKIYLATADVQNQDINFQAEKIIFEERPSRANMQPIKNSIWFAKMKKSKKVLYCDEYSKYFLDRFILSTGFAGLKCEKNSLEYIWGFVNNDRFEFIKDRLANGATQEAINNDTMVFINLIIPQDEILNKYHLKMKSIYQKIYNNQTENQKLAELRDWLLPMLMNGQVEVK